MSTELPSSSPDIPTRTLSELGEMGVSVTPKIFEVWYCHLAGENVPLSEALLAHLAAGRALTAADLAGLHDTFLTNTRSIDIAENSSRAVVLEIDGIVELIRLSLGSSNQYGRTLSTMLGDILTTTDPGRLKRIVQTLVKATEETRVVNEELEKGLQTAKSEVQVLRRLLEDARQETLKDALTGISNRRHFEQELQAAIEGATRTRRQFALLMVDIDHFKAFNDAHGHLTGDKVLRVVAHALREKFPSRATVARYGGEEFAVILPESDLMAGWVGAEAARQSILARELIKRSTGERIGRITISVGVGAWRRGDSGLSLLNRADNALLNAKRSGRNRTSTEDQLNTAVA